MPDVGYVMKSGYTDALADWLAAGVPPALTLRLFSNNVTPTPEDNVTSYVELVATGYAPIPVPAGAFTITNPTGSVMQAALAEKVFSGSGGATIYGYYLTRQSDGTLVAAFRPAAAPFTFTSSWAVYVDVTLQSPG
jgi:hypothetical protein